MAEILDAASGRHGFHRSATYPAEWQHGNAMGPNPLWLMEWLTRSMVLDPGMVVLDMGCGKAISSIFLAREFGCTVIANDLWISPTENGARIRESGMGARVLPVQSEAHALPYAQEYFDAITSVDAYQYFGTDDLYLMYFLRFLRTGGQIGITLPGLLSSLTSIPDYLRPFWNSEFSPFHTIEWWRNHWMRSGLVDIECAEVLENGYPVWLESATLLQQHAVALMQRTSSTPEQIEETRRFWQSDIDCLHADKGRNLCLLKMVARKK